MSKDPKMSKASKMSRDSTIENIRLAPTIEASLDELSKKETMLGLETKEARKAHLEKVRSIFDEFGDNIRKAFKKSALADLMKWTIVTKNVDLLKLMMERYPPQKIGSLYRSGFCSPVSAASISPDEEILDLLISSGFDIHERSAEGYLPITYAIALGSADGIKMLLDRGCDPTSDMDRLLEALSKRRYHIGNNEELDMTLEMAKIIKLVAPYMKEPISAEVLGEYVKLPNGIIPVGAYLYATTGLRVNSVARLFNTVSHVSKHLTDLVVELRKRVDRLRSRYSLDHILSVLATKYAGRRDYELGNFQEAEELMDSIEDLGANEEFTKQLLYFSNGRVTKENAGWFNREQVGSILDLYGEYLHPSEKVPSLKEGASMESALLWIQEIQDDILRE